MGLYAMSDRGRVVHLSEQRMDCLEEEQMMAQIFVVYKQFCDGLLLQS